MKPDEFALALRTLGAPLFLDDTGTATPLGIEYAATTADGKRVRVTQIAEMLREGARDPDAFVRTIERHSYDGAGIAGRALYVVELPPRGEALAARIARAGTIAPTVLAPIAEAAASALVEYHRDHGVHGSLSPRTLLVEESGTVTLRRGGIVPALLAAGVPLETIGRQLRIESYLAPELAQGAAMDARSDVFAFGSLFYEAATGRPPFGGRTTAATMAAVLTEGAGTAASPAQRLTAAVLRSIEQAPGDRWDDAELLRDALAGRTPTPGQPVAARRGCLASGAALGVLALVLWRLTHYIS